MGSSNKQTRSANNIHIYALYNKQDELVFSGTADECIKFADCTYMTFFCAISRGSYIHWKYRPYHIGTEPITEKRCTRCKKVKPVGDFYRRHNVMGKMIPQPVCKICKSEIERERRKSSQKPSQKP